MPACFVKQKGMLMESVSQVYISKENLHVTVIVMFTYQSRIMVTVTENPTKSVCRNSLSSESTAKCFSCMEILKRYTKAVSHGINLQYVVWCDFLINYPVCNIIIISQHARTNHNVSSLTL